MLNLMAFAHVPYFRVFTGKAYTLIFFVGNAYGEQERRSTTQPLHPHHTAARPVQLRYIIDSRWREIRNCCNIRDLGVRGHLITYLYRLYYFIS